MTKNDTPAYHPGGVTHTVAVALEASLCSAGQVIITCPKCFSAEDVSYQRLPDNAVLYHCAAEHEGGTEPHDWVRSLSELQASEDHAAEGVTDELLDPLSSCVAAGDPFVEYGVVEYRFRQEFPDLFRAHVRDRGHILLGPKTYTASSVRFGVALGRLARSGELLSRYGPATGAWKYNGQITYWAKPPRPDAQDITWEAFCLKQGRSPEWTASDRDGLT